MRRLKAAFALIALLLATGSAIAQAQGQGPAPNAGPKVSDEEKKMLEKMNTAPDAAQKIQAGAEFVKKFPKSPARPRVATYLAEEIARTTEPAQRVTLSQSFVAAFDQPSEADLVKPYQVDGLIQQNKLDEGFAEGAKYLEKHPEDVVLRVQLAIVAAAQAQRQNVKYAAQGKQYAAQSIQAMEGDKKPPQLDDQSWPTYKTQSLPKVYQASGVLSYVTSDKAGAKQSLEKAVALDPGDPANLMLLGTIADDEYQELAKKYNAEKSEATLKQAMGKMDEVVDWFARAIANSEGKAGYEAMQQALMQQLQQYYSFRHNNSTAGLKELIEKYKKK